MSSKKIKTLIFTDTDSGGIIHVANIKGGVGKSTVATNLAAALAKRGSTLVIDLDVQGSATHALGFTPSQFTVSSWNLFASRFSPKEVKPAPEPSIKDSIRSVVRKCETTVFPQIMGKNDITSLTSNVTRNLDLIPATSDLFKNMLFYHLQNFIYNLEICRKYYKYIIIDTPSVWNTLTKALYKHCDLNLIPVTLNALSTKSLYDYLKSVRKLARKNRKVRIRIVKNEVFGSKGSKIKGKTRTMTENRDFLESLCEQVVINSDTGVSLLPQSIIFDLEIPESATVRSAQDEGKSVQDYKQYSTVSKAFEELAKRVQFVLNNPIGKGIKKDVISPKEIFSLSVKAIAAIILIMIFNANKPVSHFAVPRPIAPQQLIVTGEQIVEHTFKRGESMTRMAKFAICHFCAIVPTTKQINQYAYEIVSVHNMTRMPGEKRIKSSMYIPEDTRIAFYPPSKIKNKKAMKLVPVYQYFTSIVDDPHAYVTGDWCERGTGGGTPHYGIDVAAPRGIAIKTPIEGIAISRNSKSAGRLIGIVKDGMVLFFAHMDKRYVKSGDRVKKGDIVGTIGMTGITSGPHVHIGYGLATPSASTSGILFGRSRYKLTDPKLFFYREKYLN